MMIRKKTSLIVILFVMTNMVLAALDPVQFKDPPAEARPMTWMHMMNNNASKEGLAKDLQALADVGVGGALIFSIKKGIADGQVQFNSPEFREIIVHGAKEAERLGLKIGVHNCDGWSSSGGPWVEPKDAMKRVVWSESVVTGGRIDIVLPRPAVRADFYRDIAVVAYPVPEEELQAFNNRPVMSSSAGQGELDKLTDATLDTEARIGVSKKEPKKPWLMLRYDKPFPARSIHVSHRNGRETAVLLASNDGQNFKKVTDLKPSYRSGKIFWAYEESFPVVVARYFKIEFSSTVTLVSVDLAPFTRLPAWLGQTSVSRTGDDVLQGLKYPAGDSFVPVEKVQVVSDSVTPAGRCRTTLPKGIWRIMRFGYTITGAYNHPATDSGRGWECDKLDANALDKHFAAYVGKLAEECGPLTGQSFYFSEIDSYEMGGQNWTGGMEKIFQKEAGYDLVPFLPLLAGRLIGDGSTANAILNDFRGVVGDLFEKNYFHRFTELCHKYGMKSYIEPYGNAPFNNLTVGGRADIPMGEFWMDGRGIFSSAVSSAHTYGKPVISSESFTSWSDLNWKVHPYLMKESGDRAWIAGVNEFMFHRFAHQANPHVAPGMTMDNIGSHIDRTQTWWYNAGKAWMKYLQRGSWLLRQGVPFSDILIYVGEGTPDSQPSRDSFDISHGYNYDYCDTHVLTHRIEVKDGKLVLPEGTAYSYLMLYNCKRISMNTLNRLHELARAGAIIIGPKPVEPLGYLERKNQRAEFNGLVDRLWGRGGKANRVGKGVVIGDRAFPIGSEFVNIEPDFTISQDPEAAFIHRQVGRDDVYFFRNSKNRTQKLDCSFRIADRIPELWFADTGRIETQAQFSQADGRTKLPITLEPYGSLFVIFRRPSKGLDPVSKISGPDEHARVVLDEQGGFMLQASKNGTYQIEHASGTVRQVKVTQVQNAMPFEGSWQVTFDGPGLKNESEVQFPGLIDWIDHQREDIRHFSGTAAYHKSIEIPKDWMNDSSQVYLDLGRVEIAAEVLVNGKVAGILWKPPFVINVTEYIQAGKNDFEIRVTNLWTNRLIGDESLPKTDGYKRRSKMPDWYINNQPMPEGARSTFTTYDFYDKDRELLPSGLLGPVTVFQKASVAATAEASEINVGFARYQQLMERKRGFQQNKPKMQASYKRMIERADRALKQEIVLITDKKRTPPSGDKRDYLTLAPYWWPDPKKADGLPYIRRDGRVNPNNRGENTDYSAKERFFNQINTLGTAAFYTGDRRYAEKAVAWLQAWFVNPQTRMNPHLEYAQGIPGLNDGRCYGIIEWCDIDNLITPIQLLRASNAIPKSIDQSIKEWFEQYLEWLQTSQKGQLESSKLNNHATWYDVQVSEILLFLGKKDEARHILENVKSKRIAMQIEPDGRQPHELARTKSLSYSKMNLSAFKKLANLGEKVGVDLWNYETPDGRSIRKAQQFLDPYLRREKKWGYPQL